MTWLPAVRRRGRLTALTGAATVLAMALAACGSSAGPAATGAASPGGATASPSGSPAPAASSSPGAAGGSGFQVLSMSFVSDARGFALGTVPCGTDRCVALLATTDGGSTWRSLTPPTKTAASYGTCQHGSPCVQQVRFATPQVGYAFDPSLLMTTDGGRHWRKLPATGVGSLEAADGTVIRVYTGTAGCSGKPYQVQSAPAGSTSWTALGAPVIEKTCAPVLYRQGSRVVLVGYGNAAGGVPATAMIDRSGNAGRTWAAGPDQCGGKDGYASSVALAPPDVLVLLCQHQQPESSGRFGPAWIRVSVNGGATFGPDRAVPTETSATKGFIVRYQLAAASSGRLLVTETGVRSSQVLVTTDGGRNWSTTLRAAGTGTGPGPGTAGLILVGFQDSQTARIAQGGTVWTTTDGGRTWRADPLSAG